MKAPTPEQILQRRNFSFNLSTLRRFMSARELKVLAEGYCKNRLSRGGARPITEQEVQVFDRYQSGKIDLVGVQKAFGHKNVNSTLIRIGRIMDHLYQQKKAA